MIDKINKMIYFNQNQSIIKKHNIMKEDDLMLKYIRGEVLNEAELNFLEDKLIILINEARLSNARPPIASNSICDFLGLRRESFKMNCLATILDKIKPRGKELCREQMVFHVLLQSKFLYY